MFTTTLAAFALAGGIGSGVIPSTPNWHTDYAQAMTRSSAEGKPMAVFIGHGAEAIRKMREDGSIPNEAAKVLAANYVCVYLDSDSASGKDLAGRFEMNQGLVISNRGGSLQAFRQSGSVKGSELTESLSKYAIASQPVTTVVAGAPTVRYVASPAVIGGCANGSCGTTYTIIPGSGQYVYPAGYGTYSTCPNGRCPNQR